MISSPSVGRKNIHFPAFPDGLGGDCRREARQAVDGFQLDMQLSLQAGCGWLFRRNSH